MKKPLTTTAASLMTNVGKLIQALNGNGNSLIAIHAIHQLNVPQVQCHKHEPENLIAEAKATLKNLNLGSSQGPAEKIKTGHLLHKVEEGTTVAVFITRQPVDDAFLQPLSLKLVPKADTAKKKVKDPIPA